MQHLTPITMNERSVKHVWHLHARMAEYNPFSVKVKVSFLGCRNGLILFQLAGVFFFFLPRPRDLPSHPLRRLSSLNATHRHRKHQGLFDAFFSFISRGVFTAVDVNNDGRIEDTEVEVAILKV